MDDMRRISLDRMPTTGREARFGLCASRIRKDFESGTISATEYEFARAKGLLDKEFGLTG